MIEDSDDNDELICDMEDNSLVDNSSEPENEMENGSLSGNFKAACYCSAWINLHASLPEQVACVFLIK